MQHKLLLKVRNDKGHAVELSPVCLGHRLLHFSWLCVVMKRAFVHESKTIIKWAVADCLMMPMDNSPLKEQEFWPVCEFLCIFISVIYNVPFLLQFLFKDLLSILNDSFLYTRLVLSTYLKCFILLCQHYKGTRSCTWVLFIHFILICWIYNQLGGEHFWWS